VSQESPASSQGSIIDVAARYDQFQSEAVANIINDYRENLAGRFLLVIPTGGGKTFTAVKAVNKLFENGMLDSGEDRVLWTAHRTELKVQAIDTFEKYAAGNPDASFMERVDFEMISRATSHVRANPNVKIVVIDEAHHAATTNTQYGPLFAYPKLGILGLTATPSRHDGQPLEFDKESYSIGFPDLVEKQIILSPGIRSIDGIRAEGISRRGATYEGLEELESEGRDQSIIKHILEHREDYDKLIIYAASVTHSRNLRSLILKSEVAQHYESIDYITGEAWSGGGDRKSFIERVKRHDRSIIINHDVLTEGYDDPKVNAVIMARPSKSKLVYMQAIGRAVRVDPGNPNKEAYIVEVVDDLPNIRYRIDNRWLFSEISDTLEPAVLDEFFGSEEEFKQSLAKVYADFNVDKEYQVYPTWNKSYRYSILLFRSLLGVDPDTGENNYRNIPILVDNENRSGVSNWFNFLSERMEKNRKANKGAGINAEQAMLMARSQTIECFQEPIARQLVYEAMENASEVACKDHEPGETKSEPWITFVALRFRENEISEEILEFISDMVNRDQMERIVRERSFEAGSVLLKLPLPLSSFIGQVLTSDEFEKVEAIVRELFEIKNAEGNSDHRKSVCDLLDRSILPSDLIYRESLPTIIREGLSYHLTL
jgi:superfamily II DNA or RNA helicase